MADNNIKTPGVYIKEINAFPNAVVPVATAIPAFIGYTPQAEYEGKSYLNKARKITSFAEFQAIYMLSNPPPPGEPASQYSPQYYLVEQADQPARGSFMVIAGKCYSILPDPHTIYYLYNSVRLFYENGGGEAYIVSVGSYGESGKKPLPSPADQIVNPNVKLADLQTGLALLQNDSEPTMYICPEATLLSVADNGTLMQAMLKQAQSMQTAVCIFDITGGHDPDPILYTDDIETFRLNTGTEGLQYGVSYYPFLGTTIMQPQEINYTNLFGGDVTQLEPLINPLDAPNATVSGILDTIKTPPPDPLTNNQYSQALINASPTYETIINHVLSEANALPPSGAMAGVYTTNDNNVGVWKSPANVSLSGVSDLTIHLSDQQQGDLNVDAVTGKSINAIRSFPGQGILVWGARTLEGNSLDWRYVAVRRTVTMLEQTIKVAANAYVFESNNANTWSAVKSAISSFLMSIWKEGGLQGSAAADAFQVDVGLGSTMTPEDLLKGIMRITVKVAVTHPAEFIVISFEQEMAKSG